MKIEITDLDMMLNYLETTSLEPHDDYSSVFTYKEQKILYKYIKKLQQENKQLKDNWDKLKEHIKEKISEERSSENLWLMGCYDEDKLILEKMEELE